MKQEDREVALNPQYFRAPGSREYIDISTLDESNSQVFQTIYYKEIPMDEQETLIVTSPLNTRHTSGPYGRVRYNGPKKILDSPGKKTGKES